MQILDWASTISFNIDVLHKDIVELSYGADLRLPLGSEPTISFECILKRLEARLEAIVYEVISLNREASLNDNSDLKVARAGFILWESVQAAHKQLDGVGAAGPRAGCRKASLITAITAAAECLPEKYTTVARKSLQLKRQPLRIQATTPDNERTQGEDRLTKRKCFLSWYIGAIIVVLAAGIVLVLRLSQARVKNRPDM